MPPVPQTPAASKRGRPRTHATNAARQADWRQRRKRQSRLGRQEQATPQDLFDALNARFHFTLDVCASQANAKCARYYTQEEDALLQPWSGVCWCNPPYAQILPWVKKAWESAQHGATVVCLVPASTDSVWWQTYVQPYAEIEWLKKRVKFNGAAANARFPVALAIFWPQHSPPPAPAPPPAASHSCPCSTMDWAALHAEIVRLAAFLHHHRSLYGVIEGLSTALGLLVKLTDSLAKGSRH